MQAVESVQGGIARDVFEVIFYLGANDIFERRCRSHGRELSSDRGETEGVSAQHAPVAALLAKLFSLVGGVRRSSGAGSVYKRRRDTRLDVVQLMEAAKEKPEAFVLNGTFEVILAKRREFLRAGEVWGQEEDLRARTAADKVQVRCVGNRVSQFSEQRTAIDWVKKRKKKARDTGYIAVFTFFFLFPKSNTGRDFAYFLLLGLSRITRPIRVRYVVPRHKGSDAVRSSR